MEQEQKWKGKAFAMVTGFRAHQIWPLLEDFLGLHKWVPGIDTCNLVEGISGQPGCVRYCAKSSTTLDGNIYISWATERLLFIDGIDRCLSYEVVDSNMGFRSYVAVIKVSQEEDNKEDGCKIEWSFESDPIEGWKPEGLVSYINSSLQGMVEKMEAALLTDMRT